MPGTHFSRVLNPGNFGRNFGTKLAKQSFLEQLGLRNGDILKGVNGQKLNSPNDAFQAYQQLLNEPLLQLEVERGEGQQIFTYEVH